MAREATSNNRVEAKSGKPKVSVVITTYNRASFLEEAIISVLNQTYKDFELLILDNSSSDNTEDVVKKFKDRRIVYVRHEPMNISKARNLGIRKSRGEFVGFLDDDDEWLPPKLSSQLRLFDRLSSKMGMVYGGFLRVGSDGKVYEIFKPSLRGDIFERYLCNLDPLTGSASNPLIRREVFDAVGGYDENLKTSEDWEFYLRLARKYGVDFVSEPVVKIRRHGGYRLGGRLRDAAETELKVLSEFSDFFHKNSRCHSYYLQVVGGKYCRLGDFKEGREYLLEAIKADYLNIIVYFQYVFSFLGKSFYIKLHELYKMFH